MKIDKFMGMEVAGAYQRYLDRQSAKPETKKQAKPETNLETLADFWTIANVEYRNGIYTVDLAKQLLDNGNAKTQDEWAEYSNKAKQNNGFYTGDFPLYYAIFASLYNSRNGNQKDEIEEIRQFLKKSAFENWLMTLTRIRHNPKGQKDKIIHNYKQQDQYEIEIDSFIGEYGYIENTKNVKEPLQALMDTQQSVKEINSVCKWLTDADTYIWRINSDVQNTEERVARFSANSYRADLDCGRNPQDSSAEIGVRAARAKI